MIEIKEGMKFRAPSNAREFYAIIQSIYEVDKLLEFKKSQFVDIVSNTGEIIMKKLPIWIVQKRFERGEWVKYE